MGRWNGKEEIPFVGNDVKIRAQWRKFVVICIVVQEIDWAKNVGGASVGRGRRMRERGGSNYVRR
ncbi:hypothetical protein [Bacillus cereus]|uniref:hypothetical protein n=1 Tax=Bacillus cereus TaxID=1396 RepID=UPI0018CF8785|nr:hypothetical protein [Bacillus cereus]MBG9615809.1 hypothetical protein [Bacillus cereus]